MEQKLKEYTVTYHRGIDDLILLNPIITDEWGKTTFVPTEFCKTEEEYVKDVTGYRLEAHTRNKEYVEKLESTGRFKEPYNIDLFLKSNPVFDEPSLEGRSIPDSYRVVYLDPPTIEEVKNLYYVGVDPINPQGEGDFSVSSEISGNSGKQVAEYYNRIDMERVQQHALWVKFKEEYYFILKGNVSASKELREKVEDLILLKEEYNLIKEEIISSRS